MGFFIVFYQHTVPVQPEIEKLQLPPPGALPIHLSTNAIKNASVYILALLNGVKSP